MRASNENGAEAPPSATATLDSPGHRHETGTAPMVAATTDDNQTRLTRYPVVPAVEYPPAGRRSRPLFIAGPCPFCHLSHAHHGGGARRAGCRNAVYWLAVRHG